MYHTYVISSSRYSTREFNTGAQPFMLVMMMIIIIIIINHLFIIYNSPISQD